MSPRPRSVSLVDPIGAEVAGNDASHCSRCNADTVRLASKSFRATRTSASSARAGSIGGSIDVSARVVVVVGRCCACNGSEMNARAARPNPLIIKTSAFRSEWVWSPARPGGLYQLPILDGELHIGDCIAECTDSGHELLRLTVHGRRQHDRVWSRQHRAPEQLICCSNAKRRARGIRVRGTHLAVGSPLPRPRSPGGRPAQREPPPGPGRGSDPRHP